LIILFLIYSIVGG